MAKLDGLRVTAAGQLVALTRTELARLVAAHGGRFVRRPSRRTRLVVVGQKGWPIRRAGRIAAAITAAMRLRDDGHRIELVTEEEFLARLGLHEPLAAIRRLYTLGQLAELLGLAPTRIRAWIRLGLVQPARGDHRLAWFDFRQVAGLRSLVGLLEQGVDLRTLRKALARLRRAVPGMEPPLGQLAVLARRGGLVLRRDDGRLVDPTGQLRLDFDAGGPQATLAFSTDTADEWFDRAAACEQRGELGPAAIAYRKAARLDPGDPVIAFNLGSVLYELGRVGDAIEELRRAVRLDPLYIEAWNNLGVVAEAAGDDAEALAAYRRALALLPAYDDARHNLARLLRDSEGPPPQDTQP